MIDDMINDIVAGVTLRLDEAFNGEDGGKYRIYAEDTEQDLNEPCFVVQVATTRERQLLGPRSERRAGLDIVYIPKREGNRREINDIAVKLFDNLRWIKRLDGTEMFGLNRHAEYADGNLHFFIEFLYTAILNRDTDAMREMNDKERVKRKS